MAPPFLPGLAGMAAAAEPLDARNSVVYSLMQARTLLNRCQSTRMPFAWTLNPYRGCEFGCHYCYARYTHEFLEMRDTGDFERRIFVKRHAAALLRRDLRKVKPGEWIALGTATDPYQPAERHYRVTRSLLEVFASYSGLRLSVISKSDAMVQDLELWRTIAARNRLSLRLTITTLDADLARVLEPRAPRPDLRLRAVRELAAAGLEVGVMCAPVLPGINDSVASLDGLAAAAAAAGARTFSASPLYLMPAARTAFFALLQEQYPRRLPEYERRFAHGAYLSTGYTEALRGRVEAIRRRHGFAELVA